MGWLIGLGLIILFFGSLVLPWVHRSQIADLQEQVRYLRSQLGSILALLHDRKIEVPEDVLHPESPKAPQAPYAIIPKEVMPPAPMRNADMWQSRVIEPVSVPIPSAAPQPQKESAVKSPLESEFYQQPPQTPHKPEPEHAYEFGFNFEQQFGKRLPVWIGSIALILAGFFLVKYTVDSGLLNPLVRLVMGLMFGMGMVASASYLHHKPKVADSARITQALAGAGIADLYICLFTGTHFYHLLSPIAGFIGMALVTALAVISSLRYGVPVALLGLIGGMLTPALVGGGATSAPLLFLYLYFVLAGLFFVIRQQNWWWLSIPAVGGALLWVVFWVAQGFPPSDGIWLGFFLFAVSTTMVVCSKQAMEAGLLVADGFEFASLLNYLTLGSAVVLMGVVSSQSGFTVSEWGMFGLLAVGGIVLAYVNPTLYGFVPWLSMLTTAVMALMWKDASPEMLAFILTIFLSIYGISAYASMWRSREPMLWGGLMLTANILYYLVGYARLHHFTSEYVVAHPAHWASHLPLWGGLALMFSVFFVCITQEVLNKFAGEQKVKNELVAGFAATATAFISIGLAVELKYNFLPMAISMQMLAVSLIYTRLRVPALRAITLILAGAFGVLMLPEAFSVLGLILDSLFSTVPYGTGNSLASVNTPLVQLGIPAAMFALTSLVLRRDADGAAVARMEIVAVILAALAGYYTVRHAFHPATDVLVTQAGFAERGVITNLLMVFALCCFQIGLQWNRPAIARSAVILTLVALLRIVYFDLFIHNPLWSHADVGSTPIINALLLVYGLPILWVVIANQYLVELGREFYLRLTGPLMLVLVLALITFNVRQLFHGMYLDQGITSNAEFYTYSAAWLISGVVLLVVGTMREDKVIRLASLALMIITVGKVFLYDASELSGLYRVFSFLGLGMSLMALSWFYTRFVFGSNR